MQSKSPPNLCLLCLRLLSLGLIIPLVFSAINYFGFFSNYTCCVFNEQGFRQQYVESSVYRYRVLGVQLLLKIYALSKEWPIEQFAPYTLKGMDPLGDVHFYFAYFLQNSLFFCLSCLLLVLLLQRHARQRDFLHIDLPVLALAGLMAMAQFVITPYDMLSYSLLALGMLLTLAPPSALNSLALCISMVLATLTRETATLMLCFYAAIHWQALLHNPRGGLTRQQKNLLAMALLFVISYWALRWQLGFYHATHRSVRWLKNLQDPLSLAGLLLFPALLSLFFTDRGARRPLLVFLLTATPYWLAMPIVAYPWEIRLWVPVIMAMTVIKLLPETEATAASHQTTASTASTATPGSST